MAYLVLVLALVLVLLLLVAVMLFSIITTSYLGSSTSTIGFTTSSLALSGRACRVHIKMSENMSLESAEYVEDQDLEISDSSR